MKKILFLSLYCFTALFTYCQGFLTKVPSSATLVVKYSGENFSKNLPVEKLDSYGFIRNDVFKALHLDSLSSLRESGIDLSQDILQYLVTSDSCTNFVTMLHLRNKNQLLALLKPETGFQLKKESRNGFEIISLSNNSFIAVNGQSAIFVNSIYANKLNYWQYAYGQGNATVMAIDSASVDIVPIPPPPPPPPVEPVHKPKKPAPKKVPAPKGKPAKKATVPPHSKPKTSKPKVEEPEEDVVVNKYPYPSSGEDSVENMKRELWEQQQEMLANRKQQQAAGNLAQEFFNGSVKTMADVESYKKIIDPAAHVSVWMNTENLLSQYSKSFTGVYSVLYNSPFYNSDSSAGFKSAANIYFDKDKMRIEQKSYSTDAKMTGLMQNVMASHQSQSLLNYVNPGNVSYFSISVNSEATANYYYEILRKYMAASLSMREYADVVDLYIDFLEIAVDEKALSDIAPGNMMFVVHDLKPKTVTYTDYNFDSEYNKTEVKRTKTELSPEFSFIIETRKEGFMQKLARLPLKYAEKEHYRYKDLGGYYELSLDSSNVLGNLYFMVKDGKALVTSSKDIIEMTLANKGFPGENESRKSIMNNNYSLQLNADKLIEKLSGEFTTGVNKKITAFLKDNVGNLKMESSLKDGLVQSTSTLGIKGNHSNSLEFFFNMIDGINNIIEADKLEQAKKLD